MVITHSKTKLLLSGVALVLAGCGGLPTSSDNSVNEAEVAVDNRLTEAGASTTQGQRAQAIDLSDKTDTLEFEYVIPPEATAYPVVKDWMTAHAKRLKERAERDARADQEAAKRSGFPYRTHSNGTRWSTVADTPVLLAVQGLHFFYTGGAHPMTTSLASIYDKKTNKLIRGLDLFTNRAKTVETLTPLYCEQLDAQRLEKRGEATSTTDMFGGCPDLVEATILPVSTTAGRIDKLRVILDPYVAGPYVEGNYVIELPADQTMVDLVKADYQGVFIGR